MQTNADLMIARHSERVIGINRERSQRRRPWHTSHRTACSTCHRYWCAANYLTIGQIYLQENPLLREPLQPGTHQAPVAQDTGRPRLGLSFIYVQPLNRLIQDTDANLGLQA